MKFRSRHFQPSCRYFHPVELTFKPDSAKDIPMAVNLQQRPKFSELAAQIATNAKILEDYIESQGLPYPSFAVDGPSNFPVPQTPETEAIHEARQSLLTASKQIYDLATGPNEHMRWLVWNVRPHNHKLVSNIMNSSQQHEQRLHIVPSTLV